jgi:hypothetical protein
LALLGAPAAAAAAAAAAAVGQGAQGDSGVGQWLAGEVDDHYFD